MRLMAMLEETRAWEAANPEVAEAWNAAIAEEERLERIREDAERERRRQAEAPERLVRCGVGELEADAFRAGLRPTPALDAVRRWIEGDRLMLLLHGGAGSGKSVAGATVMLQGAEEGCRFITADWFARLSYFDMERYEPLCRARWLVLDDIGIEQNSSTFLASLEGLTSERLRHKRRTVLTTNLSPAEFAERFAKAGSRLASRLHQHAMVAGTGADDLRRQR